MVKIPATIPYFKFAVAVTGLFAAVWLALEGELWRDVLLAAAVLLVSGVYLVGQRCGGRVLSGRQAVAWATAAGLVYGLGLVLLVLFLMALKTGLHAHGSEYSRQEVAWIWSQLPIWGGAGALVGLGLGLLAVARE